MESSPAPVHSLDEVLDGLAPPRVAVAAVSGDEVVWVGERGGIGAEHPMRVASNVKQFTGTAIMQLRDAGRLTLDDPVSSHVPEAAQIGEVAGDLRQVTLLRLLQHRSGLQTEMPSRDYERGTYPDLDEVAASLADAEIVVRPDAFLKYSNLGYRLLELVVERTSGRSHAEYVTERLLAPLCMSGASFDGPHLQAGVLDMARWVMFNTGALESEVLSPATLSEIHTVGPVNDPEWRGAQCHCWPVRRDPDGFTTWHTGHTPGFSSALAFDRAHRIGVAAGAPLDTDLLPVATAVLSALREHALPSSTPVLPPLDEDRGRVHALVGRYETSSGISVEITQRAEHLYLATAGQGPDAHRILRFDRGVIRLGGYGRLAGERLHPTEEGFGLVGLRFRKVV